MLNKNNLTKSTILITIFSIIGIIISFGIQLLIAYYYGTKFERDSYFLASTIPVYFSAIFTGSFGIIFLPQITKINIDEGERSLNEFLNSLFIIIVIILFLLTILLSVNISFITNYIAKGYTFEQKNVTSRLILLMVPSIIFSVFSNLLNSLYHIKQKFIKPAIAPILGSFINLVFVFFLNPKFGVVSLSIGFLINSIFTFSFLLYKVPIFKFKLDFFKKVKINYRLKYFFYTSIPLFITGIFFRTTSLFERMIGTGLPTGSISYLGYSGQIISILATLISSGIAVSIYPILSSSWSTGDNNMFNHYFIKGIRLILILSLPLTSFILIEGEDIIKILFERGAFNSNSSNSVSLSLSLMSFSLIFTSLGSVIVKIFYLSNKTILLSILELAGLLFYIIPAYYLSKYYGFYGLAFTLSLSSLLSIVLSTFFCVRIIDNIDYKALLVDIYNILKSMFISILALYFLKQFLNALSVIIILKIFICTIIYFLIYLSLLKFYKNSEVDTIFNIFIKKIKSI